MALVPAGPASAHASTVQADPVTLILPINSYAYSRSSNTNFTSIDALVGRSELDNTLFRSHFGFQTELGGQTFRGGTILSATFSIVLKHSWACSPTPTSLHRTGPITVPYGQRMPWNSPSPTVPLATASAAANYLACGQPNTVMYFDHPSLSADLQAAADANLTQYTVLLCACDAFGANENVLSRWKRFHASTATLTVTYLPAP
jgi:hypothetical protein